MWQINPVDAYLEAFIAVLDAAMGYLEGPIFGLYDTLLILGIAALSVFLLRGGQAYFDRLGPRVLYLGGLGFILDNFGTIAQAIANSFVFLGLAAGGGQMAEYTFWHPGLLAQFGNEAAEPLRQEAAKLSIVDPGGIDLIFWYGLAAFLLKVSFYVMATAVFVAIVGFKLGVVAAFVLAASAALPRLAWMASGGFGFVISAGVGLFSYALILSVVNAVSQNLFSGAELATDRMISLAILTAVINFGLVLLGPSMIRSVMSGVASMGLGAAATAAGAAAGVLAAPVAGGIGLARNAPALIKEAGEGVKNTVARLQDMALS
jgi:type IV secretion system protein TrbL